MITNKNSLIDEARDKGTIVSTAKAPDDGGMIPGRFSLSGAPSREGRSQGMGYDDLMRQFTERVQGGGPGPDSSPRERAQWVRDTKLLGSALGEMGDTMRTSMQKAGDMPDRERLMWEHLSRQESADQTLENQKELARYQNSLPKDMGPEYMSGLQDFATSMQEQGMLNMDKPPSALGDMDPAAWQGMGEFERAKLLYDTIMRSVQNQNKKSKKGSKGGKEQAGSEEILNLIKQFDEQDDKK